MIRIKDMVPQVYSEASRDFQYLSILFDIVLNSVKTNTDLISSLPNRIQADSKLTELLALTLGFKLKRNYDREQLLALVHVFPKLLRAKGTLQAVQIAGDALVKASHVPGFFYCEVDQETHILKVTIPPQVDDITLFIDLLPYILPAGIACDFTRGTTINEQLTTTLELDTGSIEILAARPIPKISQADNKFTVVDAGLGTLITPDFYNTNNTGVSGDNIKYLHDGAILVNTEESEEKLVPNAFLQANMIIPMLTTEVSSTVDKAEDNEEENN